MTKTLLTILSTAAAMVSTTAMAQTSTTGTITLNGTVADKCSVVSAANGASDAFADARNLQDLSKADGTVQASATLEGLFGTTAATAPGYRVVCTVAAPKVSVRATALKLANSPGAPSGYADTVDFTATASFTLSGTAPAAVSNLSTAASATNQTLGARLAASGNNVLITTSAYKTPNAGDLLMAGGYTGTIVVTVSAS